LFLIDRIKLNGKEIVLVGTAHISNESVELAKQTIIKEKPEAVGIELCEQRAQQLEQEQKWQNTNIMQVIKNGQAYLLLLNLFLANMQRRLGEIVQVKPGSEMIEAKKTAEENNIPVLLLDRNIQITLKRAFTLMPLKEKLSILFMLISGFFSGEEKEINKKMIEELKQKDMLSKLLEELGKKAPTVKRVLVDERDSYIAESLKRAQFKKIVAVLGAGHLFGVKQKLSVETNVSELLVIPEKKSLLSTAIKFLIPALFVLLFGFAFVSKGAIASVSFFAYWFLITGFFSALGALVARAHPLAILTAFVAAPFTTLHPALASGWFAAAVEAKYNPPKVSDLEQLNQLNSIGDFTRNQATRILLVAALTNIGSTIGVVIAFPALAALLH
jgi:pheromone shutdown-related protein TraB